jgi:hypothetical protein
MKAPFTLGSAAQKAINIVALVGVAVGVTYPYFYAQADESLRNTGKTAQIFEVKNLPTQNFTNTDQTLYQSITIDEITQADPLVQNLREYLERHNSPLAQYADQIVLQPQWQRALAISWGESNFGIHCHSNNCSGIGGAPGRSSWRKYPTKLEWFKDMSQLLETPRYKERFTNCRTMNGVYNAGSNNWLRACEQKSNELISLTEKSNQERLALTEAAHIAATPTDNVIVAVLNKINLQ